MSHLDDETIALAALGESLDDADAAHLAGCDECRLEVESLAGVVAVARSSAGPLVAPPPEVWARIAAETGVDPGVRPVSLDERRTERVASADPRARELSGSTGGRTASGRTRLLVAASVAGLILGVGGTLAWQSVGGGGDVVATARLAPLPDKVGSGEAEVVDTSDGRELEMQLDTPLPSDAFLQVWLLSPDATRMVPVGVISGESGHWTLPPDVTLADYPVVDVSIEPYDGEATHSGNSVVRGTLDVGSALRALDPLD